MSQRLVSDFKPAWWLPGAHLQTLWPTLVRRRISVAFPKRRIELADGDFIDLTCARVPGPRVLLVHGLEGNLRSHYAGSLIYRLIDAGFSPIFMHLRGCSGEPNRLARAYHSGASDDLAEVLNQLAADPEGPVLAVIGVSLGGNILLKYLGETPTPLVKTAIAVSVPFVLRDAMLRLNRGVSRIYRDYLLRRLKLAYRAKFANRPAPVPVDIDQINDLESFDDWITAPLNGFASAFDYYQRCSCRQFLPRIHTPTLIIHALDDPFVFPDTVPKAHELGPGVMLEVTRGGGHVGFLSGPLPWRPQYWLEERILRHLATPEV
ncbi:hydrolase [Thioalkalicoccus limnaeus]|uniref:Hydrolase n=1 Tax=Thioalkalicoccus limnaeus TaxID=120681 RepID=A0ABV4BFK1_9GAMM